MASVKDIQNAMDEVKEYLILNNFNNAMMLIAQITIEAIEYLVDENLIVSKGYEEDLKTLLASNIITESTAHNFEALIISGVQANKGVDIPKEYAEQSCEVLSHELEEILHLSSMPIETTNGTNKARSDAMSNNRNQIFEYNEDEDKSMDVDEPAFMSNDDDIDFRQRERLRQNMYKTKNKKSKYKWKKLIALLIPIILMLIIAFMVKSCINGFATGEETTITSEEPTSNEYIETEETTTVLPTSEAGFYRITGDIVNIRAQANSSSSIIARLSKNEVIQVTSFYDKDWANVRYNGRDAFVSRQYIVKDETQTLAPEYSE